MNEEVDHYFVEIEAAFNFHRGAYRILSPLDWALMEEWKQRGVPLHIIVNGIRDVLLRKHPRDRALIKSLSFCQDEIEEAFEMWLAGQVGASNTA